MASPVSRRAVPARSASSSSIEAITASWCASFPPRQRRPAAKPRTLQPRPIPQPLEGTHVTMQWIADFRHAWRALLRTPGFLVTSVTTLALAIGAVVGMFSVVNTVLLRPLPFPDADRLVVLSGTAPGSDLPPRFGLGPEFYLHYKERSKLLDG